MSIAYSRPDYSPFLATLSSADRMTYLAKLGVQPLPEVNLTTLQKLHYLHPQVFAFESLSPLLGMNVALETGEIFQKMVINGRGGYCFEHNLLFGSVLSSLGFEVISLAGRVLWNVPENKILPRDHMALMVKLEEAYYLVDVGFGGNTLTAPLSIDCQEPQATSHEWFRVSRLGDQFVLSIQIRGNWQDMYQFGLEEYLLSDYQVISWYLCNHSDSIFTQNLFAAKTLPEERYTLKNNQFSIHRKDGNSEKRNLTSIDELMSKLHDHFKINLTSLHGLKDKLKTIPWE
jgi:N-hydroxyarylamine O-acetyltransferase